MPDDESQSQGLPKVDAAGPTINQEAALQSSGEASASALQTPTLTPEPAPAGPSMTGNENVEAGTSTSSSSSVVPVPMFEDRGLLLDRARAFLTSPQIRHEEPAAKRRFLAEKGLNEVEIEGLMRELVRSTVFLIY